MRVQWDPERDWRLNVVKNVRAIQIGLPDEAVRRYVSEWIVRIEDVTSVARRNADYLEKGGRSEGFAGSAGVALPSRLRVAT